MRLHFFAVALCIWCICCIVDQSLSLITLEPVNITSLEQRTLDQFAVALRFDPLEVAPEDINDSKVCIVVNGDICHCFGSAFKDTHLSLTPLCLQAIASTSEGAEFLPCQYWFALQLTSPHRQHQPMRQIMTSSIKIAVKSELDSQITLILPLTLDDLSRAAVLLHTLSNIPRDTVHELLVFVPDSQQKLMEGAVAGIMESLDLKFPAVVHGESVLFAGGADAVKHVFPYAIQMAVKLLAARLVQTAFYITLDADVVLLRPFNLDQIITREKKAIFHFEERAVHANWWKGSEQLLNISPASSHKYLAWQQRELCESTAEACDRHFGALQAEEQGFGVTPVVMSTYGSLLTVSYLCRRLTQQYVPYEGSEKDQFNARRTECERLWLQGFGRQYTTIDEAGVQKLASAVMLWSEYTLYRVVLDHLEVFDELHVREHTAGNTVLHCHNVWFESQLPWQAELAHNAEDCLFSVIQSTTGINPSSVYMQFLQYFS